MGTKEQQARCPKCGGELPEIDWLAAAAAFVRHAKRVMPGIADNETIKQITDAIERAEDQPQAASGAPEREETENRPRTRSEPAIPSGGVI